MVYRYVDPVNGHDWRNEGLTAAAPFKTLEGALMRVRSGDNIRLAAGEYDIYTTANRYNARVLLPLHMFDDWVTITAAGTVTFTNTWADSARAWCWPNVAGDAYLHFSGITVQDYFYDLSANENDHFWFSNCTFNGGELHATDYNYILLQQCD